MKSHKFENSKIFFGDCMEGMKYTADDYYDLAVVDPPYGIGETWNKNKLSAFKGHRNAFNERSPGKKYFEELFRVSKNQIVWGVNYYWQYFPPTNNLIFWDKKKDAIKQHGSAGELAWASIRKYPLIKIELIWNGCVKHGNEKPIHPHQKPIALYDWIFEHYAKSGDKILDTHLGSGSSRIAAWKYGLDFIGYETDEGYFNSSVKHFTEALNNKQPIEQKSLFQSDLWTGV